MIGKTAPAASRPASALIAFQQPLPPVDLAGVLADLAALRAIIAEANTRYQAALKADTGTTEPPPTTICGPGDVARLLAPEMVATAAQEQMWVVVLNSKNCVLDVIHLYTGTLNSSTVRIAELFKPAIVANGASLILAHSHPSGDPTPSPEDVTVTAQAAKAGTLLDIEVLDHVVLGHAGQFVSLKERGLGL
jgi:DNA repair protein RadC